jgi:sirohydrochlorin cobaltochelatase
MKKIVIVCLLLLCFPASSWAGEKSEKKDLPTAIVLAAFGSTYPEAQLSLLAFKNKVAAAHPGQPVLLACTSNHVVKVWRERKTDKAWRAKNSGLPKEIYDARSPLAALAELRDQGYRNVAVQSLHIYDGEEYADLKTQVEGLAAIPSVRPKNKLFQTLVMGRPTLSGADKPTGAADLARAAKALAPDVDKARSEGAALVYIGHGNEHVASNTYAAFESALRGVYPGIPLFVGLVEGEPGLEKVAAGLKEAGAKKVTIYPLLMAAGDHASNDICGDEDESWKKSLQKNGLTVRCVPRGLATVPAWTAQYSERLDETLSSAGAKK